MCVPRCVRACTCECACVRARTRVCVRAAQRVGAEPLHRFIFFGGHADGSVRCCAVSSAKCIQVRPCTRSLNPSRQPRVCAWALCAGRGTAFAAAQRSAAQRSAAQRSAAQSPLTLRGPSGRLAVGGGRHALRTTGNERGAHSGRDNRSGWAVGCSGGWRTLAPCGACTSSRTSSRSSLRQMCALPCLALPCLALPCLALPCLALPCLALPCLAFPLVDSNLHGEPSVGRARGSCGHWAVLG